MEQEYEMSLIQLFHMHWPYDKPKFMIDYVEDVHIKFIGYPLILTAVISYHALSYFAPYFLKDEVVYAYSLLFSNSCCLNNPLNVKTWFEWINQRLKERKQIKYIR